MVSQGWVSPCPPRASTPLAKQPAGAGSPGRPICTNVLPAAGGREASALSVPCAAHPTGRSYAIKAVAPLSVPPPSGSPWEGVAPPSPPLGTFSWTPQMAHRPVIPGRGPKLPSPHNSLLWGSQDLFRITEAVGGMGSPLYPAWVHGRPLPAPALEGGGSLFLKNINVFDLHCPTSLRPPNWARPPHRAPCWAW